MGMRENLFIFSNSTFLNCYKIAELIVSRELRFDDGGSRTIMN